MSAPKATSVTITLPGQKATRFNGTDMDIALPEDGRLIVYDYPTDRSHSGPIFAAVKGEWLTVALSFEPFS